MFILPVLVLLGWALGMANMTLFFDSFQTTVIFLTVLLVNYLIRGSGTWSVALYYYP
jgi:Ca2+:H+ antiporter